MEDPGRSSKNREEVEAFLLQKDESFFFRCFHLLFRKPSIPHIFIAFFVTLLIKNILEVILPQLLVHLLPHMEFRKAIEKATRDTELLIAINAFASFLSAPILGIMSDIFGRKPIFIISTAFGQHYWVFVIGRTVGGLTNAAMAISLAYVTDVSAGTMDRDKKFAILWAAVGLSLVIGPISTGYIAAATKLRFPLQLCVLLALANIVYAIIVLPESNFERTKMSEHPAYTFIPLGSFGVLKKNSSTILLPIAYFLMYMTAEGLLNTSILFYKEHFGWNRIQIGQLTSTLGVAFCIVQFFIIRLCLNHLGEKPTVVIGQFATMITSPFFTVLPAWGMYILVTINTLSFMSRPTIQGMLSKQYKHKQQGELMGVMGGLSTLATSIGPLMFGNLFAYYIEKNAWPTQLPGIPFYCAIFFSFVAFIIVVLPQSSPPPIVVSSIVDDPPKD